jgi:lysyl-tRNA synthetase class 2
MGREEQIINERKRKIEDLQKQGINPYAYEFDKKQNAEECLKSKIGSSVKTAGRVMMQRNLGKISFAKLQDFSGSIQIVLQKGETPEKSFELFKKYVDSGDFVGVEGKIFKTKTGEISILVDKLEILSKSILPLPEKFHGLQDKEERYRKRYLDLIMNPEVRDRFVMRTKIISLVREFLNKKGFVEVETPILQVLYGGTNAKPFTTHINSYDMNMYLRVAPELYLKRLLVGGFEKVYEIARNFRNEGVDQTHNPEFTMIEWYEAYGDYNSVMNDIEEMCKFIAKKIFGKEIINLHEKEIDISKKWPRITMEKAINDFLKFDVEKMSDKELGDFIKKEKIDVRDKTNRGQIIFAIFDKLVAEKLFEPTWIIDYPKEVSPLSKLHRKNPKIVERFELYIGGKEISDGWSEINDPQDQLGRFENEQNSMRKGNDEAHPMDEDFLEAMQHGMPPAGGMGMGIDRLVMLFTNHWSIRDVMLFPTMKPEAKPEIKDKVIPADKTKSKQNSKTKLPISRKQAIELLKKYPQEDSEMNHYLESEAIMKGLAEKFGEDVEYWGMLGLLHDVDWSLTKNNTKEHTVKAEEILRGAGFDDEFISTVQSHGYGMEEIPKFKDKERNKKIEHALAAAETMTGIIYAYALMKGKKISDMQIKGLKKKFKDKNFAANCNREIIREIEKTGLSFEEFFEISIESLKKIKEEIGLE